MIITVTIIMIVTFATTIAYGSSFHNPLLIVILLLSVLSITIKIESKQTNRDKRRRDISRDRGSDQNCLKINLIVRSILLL